MKYTIAKLNKALVDCLGNVGYDQYIANFRTQRPNESFKAFLRRQIYKDKVRNILRRAFAFNQTPEGLEYWVCMDQAWMNYYDNQNQL